MISFRRKSNKEEESNENSKNIKRKYDIISVGSATVDVFVKTEAEKMIKDVNGKKEEMICYPYGSKVLIDSLEFHVGGGGTNTAVAFSKAGFKAGFIGCVGKGHNGDMIIKKLKEYNVDFLGSRVDEKSGYSVILDSKLGDRTILTYKGSNNILSYNSLDKDKLDTKWFYFTSMMSKSFKTIEKLTSYAEKNDIKIAFNPSSYQAKIGIKNLKKLVKATSILIMNNEEINILLNNQDYEIDNLKELAHEIKKLSKYTEAIIVITMGSKGAVCFSNKKNGGAFYRLHPPKSKVVETTGAGDAFASGFVSAIILDKSIEDALLFGAAESTSVISYFGAKSRLLTLKEMIMRTNRFKVEKVDSF